MPHAVAAEEMPLILRPCSSGPRGGQSPGRGSRPGARPNRPRGRRCALVALGLLALPWLAGPTPAAASDDQLTIRLEDAEAEPGGTVTLELRTYSPRPLGQGQLCVVVRRPGKGVSTPAPADGSRLVGSAALEDSPFAELLGGQVFSQEGDASFDVQLTTGPNGPAIMITFASPSESVNRSDGPMATLDFRLRPDVLPGERYVIELELANSSVVGEGGEALDLRMESGELRILGTSGVGDAGVLRFDQRTYEAAEDAGLAVIAVERSHGDHGAVSVDYSVSAGSAAAGIDFETVAGTLSWPDGDEGVRTFTVPIIPDDELESTETVLLELSSPSGGAGLDDTRASAVLSILDVAAPGQPPPTSPGVVRLVASSFQGIEGDGRILAVVERTGGDAGAATVDYQTVDLSAVAGLDYVADAGTVGWSDGESGPRTIVIELLDDELAEGMEQAELQLTAASGAQLDGAASHASLKILDDDLAAAPCVTDETTLCLHQGRFAVRASWHTADRGASAQGRALSDSSGIFWFFDEDNVEMLVKVLDACTVAGLEGYWVYFSATTDVGFTVSVVDTLSGVGREYSNPLGQAALPVTDTGSFPSCP